jgi:acetyl esterase
VTPDPLDPDLAALRAAAVQRGLTPLSEIALSEARERVREGNRLCAAGPKLYEVRDVTIPSDSGEIDARVYRATAQPPGRTLVYFHGGGWVTGDLDYSDEVCRFLARDADCTVVSVGYRLAPEHSFPVPLEDAYAGLLWASKHVASPGLLAVGGDSAGGNLAASCAIRARDTSGPSLAAQLLVYPVLDHDVTRGSYITAAEAFPVGLDSMMWFWDAYAPDVADRNDPALSPLRIRDVSGLPPGHIVVAGHDPLHDEGVAYADRMYRCGIQVTLRDYPSLCHGFFRYTAFVQAARSALGELARALRTHLDRAGAADAGFAS